MFSSAKYGNAHSPVSTAPAMYRRLRPTRSERWPKNGTRNSASAAATITPLVANVFLKPSVSVAYSSTKTVKM